MELKIKDEYINLKMSSPFTSELTELRFLDKSMYIHYYNAGYQHLFEIVEPVPVPKKKEK
jgi:hypothetical protein